MEKIFLVLGFKFFVSDVTSGVVLGLFGPLHLALDPNHKMEVFAQVFLETRLNSESFKTLDDLLGFQVKKL